MKTWNSLEKKMGEKSNLHNIPFTTPDAKWKLKVQTEWKLYGETAADLLSAVITTRVTVKMHYFTC